MEQYNRHCFFIDSGVNIPIGTEINKLQLRFGFSEEMRKLLLIQSHSKGRIAFQPSIQDWNEEQEPIQWYTLDTLDDALDVIERNEDFILSDFLFVFAQDLQGNQFAEITKGRMKGNIVWFNALYYADIDSLEELIEENRDENSADSAEEKRDQLEFDSWPLDAEFVFNLLYTSHQKIFFKANSLDLFLC